VSRSETSRGTSNKRNSRFVALKTPSKVFAALGDETRLSVLARLCNGVPQSISRLTVGTNLSRQAVAKHLRVLANAGVVRSVRIGRESLFELEPQPIEEARNYLDQISKQWDDALARLKSHVEERAR
jgi:DNA-binding transcriptional ArsR family regulator